MSTCPHCGLPRKECSAHALARLNKEKAANDPAYREGYTEALEMMHELCEAAGDAAPAPERHRIRALQFACTEMMPD